MQRRLQRLTALAGIVFALTCTAHAKAAPQGLRTLEATSGRSDSNLRWARQSVATDIDMLQRDGFDYKISQ
jgi:hypothetical protein